jgi:hypothetical protein
LDVGRARLKQLIVRHKATLSRLEPRASKEALFLHVSAAEIGFRAIDDDRFRWANEDCTVGRERVKLSVILPVRNCEPYLGEQLTTLVNQECSFDWELIVVDNVTDAISPF